ncbi:MAG: ABC transporter ATP-binding protein/permease [Bacteroidia bacterium]|nr:ABC transporter ATP-binding protein/permease [Bacteroidia bacterium]
MSENTGKAFDMKILARVFSYANPYRTQLYTTFVLTIVLAVLGPIRPMMIQYTIDNYVAQFDLSGLRLMVVVMLALLLLEGVLQFYYSWLTNFLGQAVILDVRTKLFSHIAHLRLKYFDNTAIGTLVTRVISDIETLADVFSEGFLVIIGDILRLVVAVVVMLMVDWRMTLISISTVPLLLLSTRWFKNAIKSSFQDVRNAVSSLNAFLQEHITGMSIIQIFNREKEELEAFKLINANHRDANNRSVWAYSVFLPVVEVLSAISIGLVVWWGAKHVLEGNASPGSIVAFIMYINMLFRPMRDLADKFNTLQMGVVSSERIFKVLDTEEFIENNGEKNASDIHGEIRFKEVWFAYNAEDWVLKGVDFSVGKGEKLAIVGATGAGKSSIINLLTRYYEYNKGQILVDGHNIREYELASLRQNIAAIPQDVFLFSGSIADNISLLNQDISMHDMEQAAKAIGAHDFIEKLPGSYLFDVKERGNMLSVGQRQLIAFVRAYVYNPKILILDEATSSVDTESEWLIQSALEKLTQGRTSIIIAHRLATVQFADRILVMDKGEIVEQGSHAELMQKENGAYRRLFELQFKKEESLKLI